MLDAVRLICLNPAHFQVSIHAAAMSTWFSHLSKHPRRETLPLGADSEEACAIWILPVTTRVRK